MRRDKGIRGKDFSNLSLPLICMRAKTRRREPKMSDFYLLPRDGQFYKANLHCHTVLSDGSLTPEEIKEEYRKRGYSVVAFTDHDHYAWHRELDDDGFLALAAYETQIEQYPACESDWPKLKVYHLNLYDRHPEERNPDAKPPALPERRYEDLDYINGYIRQMGEEGFLVCYNHAYWSLQTHRDYSGLRGLWAMEIYNHGCEQDGLYGYTPQVYDEMLRSGQRLYTVATDDNHNRDPFDSLLCDSFGGFVMIKAESLTYSAVMGALERGEFYFSCGPQILEAYIHENKLRVKTSPVEKIYVIQEGRDCYREAAAPGGTITEAEFTLTGHEGYIRIDIRDSKGRHAGTNSYWMEDILAAKLSEG